MLNSLNDSGIQKASAQRIEDAWFKYTHLDNALVEFRNLRAKEAQDAKAGALVGLYRHFDKGIKAGIGYNFTDYSDDLTDLSYRSRGFFINVLARY